MAIISLIIGVQITRSFQPTATVTDSAGDGIRQSQ